MISKKSVADKRLRLSRSIILMLMLVIASLIVAGTVLASGAPTPFFNGFETNTAGWFDGSGFGQIIREPSGYTNAGGYANGIASSAGGFHARLSSADCQNDFGPGTDCLGPYTYWGTDGFSSVFPSGGYKTQVDIYLDTTWASTHPDVRFDWDSAIQDTSANFLSDFVFNAGTSPAGFVIGASPNAFRNSTFPANPCPNPGPSTPPNTCRIPVTISASGWYTFRHTFRDDGTGHLAVDLTILDHNGATVANWTIYQGFLISTVGGPAYGWFANEEIADLPIDNSELLVAVGPPINKDQCKNDGWKSFNTPRAFKNQGDCIQYVNTGK